MPKNKFPKKAKLITDGGFYQIIKIERFVPRMRIPLFQRLMVTPPEINMAVTISFEAVFDFWKVRGGYAEYRQVDVIVKNLNG